MLIRALSGTLAALCISSLAGGQTNLIENGNFDTPVPWNGDSLPMTGGGWTTEFNDFSGGWREEGGNPAAMFILNQSGDANNPTIRQVVEVCPTCNYELSGDFTSIYINDSPADATDSFKVLVDGETVYEAGPTAFGDWQQFSVIIVPSARQVTLEFQGEAAGSDNDFAVDNLALTNLDSPAGAADLNCDGVVDGADLGMLLGAWGQCPGSIRCAADLSGAGDGIVDGSDLGVLLGAWGTTASGQ